MERKIVKLKILFQALFLVYCKLIPTQLIINSPDLRWNPIFN